MNSYILFAIEFDGGYHPVIWHLNDFYVPLKPIVQRLGLKWERQAKKVRNGAYFNHHYGKNFLIRYLRPLQETLGYIFLAFFTAPFTKAYSWRDIPRFWRMYLDGIHERLGKL